MNLFIDTNIFLSFYHFSKDDLGEIHKLTVLIENGEVVLWLPEQVKDEFKRNRENKINDSMKNLEEQKNKTQFPEICKDYNEYQEMRDLQTEYNKKLSSQIQKVTEDIEKRTLRADKKILELFDKAKTIEKTQELIEKARFRMDVRNPPGKDRSLGDAINWEGLLAEIPIFEKLYIVSNDKDYYSVRDKDKPKDFLIDEWDRVHNEEVIFYQRLSQFFMKHYPDIKLAPELEKELDIKSLVNSRSFESTHLSVLKLEEYAEFNKSQANEMVQVGISNDQINWILSDHNVYCFYRDLLDNHKKVIEDELYEQMNEELVRQSQKNIY